MAQRPGRRAAARRRRWRAGSRSGSYAGAGACRIHYPGPACAENPAISRTSSSTPVTTSERRSPRPIGFARTIERMGGVTGDNAMYLRQVIEATEELEQLIEALSAVAHSASAARCDCVPSRSTSASSRCRPPSCSGHPLERDVSAGLVETDAGARGDLAGVARGADRRGAGRRRTAPGTSSRTDTVSVRPARGQRPASCSSAICAPTRASGCSSSRAPRSRSATTA